MRKTHEPQDAFIEKLESQITDEVRRRNRVASSHGQFVQSRLKLAIAALALMLVSMGIGGGVVAAAYQAQSNFQRDLLAPSYEQRLDLARQQLTLVEKAQKGAEQRLNVGLITPRDLMEGRVKVTEAEAQVKSLELQLAEVRLTGREPLNEISAPLVSGRDFVSERLRVQMSVPEAMLQFEKAQLRDTMVRVEIGTMNPIEVHTAEARTVEMAAAVDTFRLKLDIRQRFLKSELDATQAALRVLESEADQRRKALLPRIEVAKQDVEHAKVRFNVGTADRVELAEATMRLQQLNLDLAKVDVDLAIIRLRLAGK